MMNEYDIALGLQDLKADPRFDMATLNYILTGDRSGYDVIAQTAMQKKQMENAQELARAQKLAEEEYKKDELQKNLRLADADFFAAQEALQKDPNNDVLRANYKRALANREYAEQRVGRQLPADVPVVAQPAEVAAPVMTNQDLIANIEEILKGEHTNESAAKANELIGQLGDPALQEQYKQKMINRGKTKEQKAADAEARKIQAAKELKEANTVYKNTGKYDITKYVVKFKDGKSYLVRKEKK
jgi:hypothetical protein